MALVTKKPGARPHTTLQSAPSYFWVDSQRVVNKHPMDASQRIPKQRKSRLPGRARSAGAKLLKKFHRNQTRDMHATKPQFPCYGRRSER